MNNYSSGGRPKVQITTGQAESDTISRNQEQPSPGLRRSQQHRGKFVKSKSSPSSLTTHKFGLRPTPSPPRLIIDHQTGDIVESYPEHPVYLRTYQPIELTDDDDDNDEVEDDTTQNQIEDSLASQSSHPLVTEPFTEQDFHSSPSICLVNQPPVNSLTDMSGQNTRPSANQNHQHHLQLQSARPPPPPLQQQRVIPPPHAGKVYYDAPGSSPGGSLFDQRIGSSSTPADTNALSSRERAQASFRRALNTLADAERTDIAIVTEPEDGPARPVGLTTGHIRVTATSAAKGNALLAAQQQQLHQPKYASNNASKLYGHPPAVTATRDNRKQVYQPIEATRALVGGVASARKGGTHLVMQHHQLGTPDRAPPTLDESSLYNICFNLRVLLVILLSSAIIYLLTVALHTDCVRYRPTHTYVSLIASSVNLICVIIFSLFWYCRGVTRTFYQNVSASAFIVTFYSILVCVNLALAILLFFIDTCHFQKLLATRSALSELQVSADNFDVSMMALNEDPPHYDRRRQEARLVLEAIESIEHLLGQQQKQQQQQGGRKHSRRQAVAALTDDGDSTDTDDTQPPRPDPTVIDDTQLDPSDAIPPRATTTTTTTTTKTTTLSSADLLAEQYGQEYAHVPKMSPWEAFWEYLKDQAREARRSFLRFLVTYDLKFIGALHALLAACFQYLAMKVAVVRSFFSAQASPAYNA